MLNKKMNQWILFIIISLLIATTMRLSWTHFLKTFDYVDKPIAEQGVLDLRGWKFSNYQTLRLDGEWALYPDQFFLENEHEERAEVSINEQIDPQYIQVPQRWDDAFIAAEQNTSEKSFRYGTYRLRILLDPDQMHTFSIRLKNTSKVYSNGQLVAQSGKPSTSIDGHDERNVPYTATLTPENGQIDLIIETSNYAGPGGITTPIRFGTFEAIQLRTLISIGLQLLLCVVVIIHGIYALVLYFLGSDNKGILYFSLIMVSALFSILVVDDKLLLVWLDLDYVWSMKLYYVTYIAAIAFLPSLFHHLFPAYLPKKILHSFGGFSSLFAVVVLFVYPYSLIPWGALLIITMFASVSISCYILWRALRDKEDIIFLLLASSFVGINVLWSVLNFYFANEFIHYPFDLIFAIFAFSAFWFRGFFRATTEAKQLAAQLQVEHRRKDEFLMNTSHELRNPLHGIINITQSMMEDKAHPMHPEHRERLGLLIHVSQRLSLMLDDLLDVTRLKENTIRLQWTTFPLQSIVTGVVDMVKLMLDGKPIALNIDIEDSFPPIRGDKNRLIQIVFNLVHNAVKYTDEGTVTIRAKAVDEFAHIQVEDTGIGIEVSELHTIFQPYEQAELNSMRASGGFGLGLSISKQLVELHGGTLSVQSQPGQGSIFTFTVPLAVNDTQISQNIGSTEHSTPIAPFDMIAVTSEQQEQHEDVDRINSTDPTDSPDPTDRTLSNPTILAVDDDSINLNILRDMLKAEHYEVITATSANQALAILNERPVDLVISDVMMPHVSGYELARTIRDRFSILELPVLLLTARNRSQDIVTGFQSGANDYVTKPVDALQLRARVHALTKLKRSIEERLRMEGAWLQSQIQPHFIFNTLNSIAALGLEDFAKMQELIEEFSQYLRLSFDFHNSDPIIPVERELSLVRSYLNIEKRRFGDRLNVKWELDHPLHFSLPPLSIQPLVENAVQHGVMQSFKGEGTVCIRIEGKTEGIEVSIQDDGSGMSEEIRNNILRPDEHSDHRTGVGLINIDRRLKQLYGQGLAIVSAPKRGTTVMFNIPNKK